MKNNYVINDKTLENKVKIILEVVTANNTDCTMPTFEVVKIIFNTKQTTII